MPTGQIYDVDDDRNDDSVYGLVHEMVRLMKLIQCFIYDDELSFTS